MHGTVIEEIPVLLLYVVAGNVCKLWTSPLLSKKFKNFQIYYRSTLEDNELR